MFARSTSKRWNILSLLVACLLAVATVVCLVHIETLDHAHADGPEQHPGSSGHITLDLHYDQWSASHCTLATALREKLTTQRQ